jgi:hypothetical protein
MPSSNIKQKSKAFELPALAPFQHCCLARVQSDLAGAGLFERN